MDSTVADFFKEIEALTVPDELIEKAYSNAAPPKEEAAESKINKDPAPQKPASSVIKNEPTCPWQEIHDDSTGYSYYWNVNTNEVTWDCPREYTLYLQSTYKTEPTPKPTQAKKETPNPPVGSIIPISYYGNTSSSDEASDVEKDIKLPKKTEKPPKPAASKKSKQSKKHSKNKSNGHESPVIGPQLPPDFQFPVVAVKSLRPVVDYDSFSDEDEEPEPPKQPSPAKTPPREPEFLPVPKKSEPIESRPPLFPIVSEPKPETPTPDFKDKSELLITVTSSKTEPKCDLPISKMKSELQPEAPSLKRKAEVLCTKKETSSKETPSKTKSLKKAKKSDVNIDKIFAAHSAYGKHGFGFGWQVQPENEGLFAEENEPVPRPPKGKLGKNPISFVKSSDVLDLNALNQEDEEAVMEQSDEEEENTKRDASPKEQEVVEEHEVNKPDVESVSEERELESGENGEGSPEVKCEEEVTLSKADEETGGDHQKEVEVVPLVKFALEDVEEDIDEIDRVLSEALEAKKAAKSLEKTSATATSDLKTDADSTAKKPVKSPESGTESESSYDKEREILAEQSSEVIEKLTFLLASNSSVTALNAFLVQMQTRIVDWQATALDSNYFKCRLKEVKDYLDRYEASIISGDWMCKWDRENKRYFYLNKITQAAQWTYPEESSNSEASSPCNSPQNEFTAPPTHSATPEPPSSTSPVKDSFVPSPPPPPPGVDSPPPPPPDEHPPSPPPEKDPMDMDLDNSSDYTPPPPIIGRNGVEMDSSIPQVRESTFQNLGSPLARFGDFKGLSSKPTALDQTNEAPLIEARSVVPEETGKVADETSAPQPDTSRSKTNKSSISTKKEKKKKKLQLGIGLKKKNIPSLVEKWLKIKEEQEKEDKNSEVLRNEIM